MTVDGNTETQAPPVAPAKGKISEIFSSLQGEGLYIGKRPAFLRFAGGPWRCRYCDTPDSLTDDNHPEYTVDQVLGKVQKLLDVQGHRAASLTGGEPLLQADFLAALLPGIRAKGLKTYLET